MYVRVHVSILKERRRQGRYPLGTYYIKPSTKACQAKKQKFFNFRKIFSHTPSNPPRSQKTTQTTFPNIPAPRVVVVVVASTRLQ